MKENEKRQERIDLEQVERTSCNNRLSSLMRASVVSDIDINLQRSTPGPIPGKPREEDRRADGQVA